MLIRLQRQQPSVSESYVNAASTQSSFQSEQNRSSPFLMNFAAKLNYSCAWVSLTTKLNGDSAQLIKKGQLAEYVFAVLDVKSNNVTNLLWDIFIDARKEAEMAGKLLCVWNLIRSIEFLGLDRVAPFTEHLPPSQRRKRQRPA